MFESSLVIWRNVRRRIGRKRAKFRKRSYILDQKRGTSNHHRHRWWPLNLLCRWDMISRVLTPISQSPLVPTPPSPPTQPPIIHCPLPHKPKRIWKVGTHQRRHWASNSHTRKIAAGEGGTGCRKRFSDKSEWTGSLFNGTTLYLRGRGLPSTFNPNRIGWKVSYLIFLFEPFILLPLTSVIRCFIKNGLCCSNYVNWRIFEFFFTI